MQSFSYGSYLVQRPRYSLGVAATLDHLGQVFRAVHWNRTTVGRSGAHVRQSYASGWDLDLEALALG